MSNRVGSFFFLPLSTVVLYKDSWYWLDLFFIPEELYTVGSAMRHCVFLKITILCKMVQNRPQV